MKKIIFSSLFAFLAFSAGADNYVITPQEQSRITEEAEDWIDDMPDRIQDRLSDAVDHSLKGFFNEISYFRNYKDTTDLYKFQVSVKDFKGGKDGDINMRLYQGKRSKKISTLPTLIYFHGGGWSMGSIETSDKFCRALASMGNVNVISVEYPLAPENAYPKALKTCEEAVEYLFKQAATFSINKNLISLGGDGAGGNIALAVFQRLPQELQIKSLVLYYPLLKSTGNLNIELKKKYGRGYGFDSRLWESFITAYSGQETGMIKILPPTLLISAGRDIIFDEAAEFAKNPKVKMIEFNGALHGFITDGQQKTAFSKAVSLTDQFLTSH